MNGAATAAAPATGAPEERVPPRRGKWPKLHLIYFLLAMFDLAAVGGGLYLSHQLRDVFEQSMSTNAVWNERFRSIWNLSTLAAGVNAPGNDIFISGDPAAERQRLKHASARMAEAVDKVRAEIIANAPPELSSQPVRTLTYVEQSLNIMVAHGGRAIAEYEKGDIRKAAYSMALMDRSFATLKSRLNDSVSAINQLQMAFGKRYATQVESLKWFERAIGGAIILMVSCVVIYGHLVGRFVSRKYRELEAAHDRAVNSEAAAVVSSAELRCVNDRVAKLNRDLAANFDKLRDAQDEIVRKARLSQLGQLTATVAHELRNPLGAVRTSAFLIERKSRGKGIGLEPQIERINNGIRRCDDIISQLLDFARTKNLQREDQPVDDWLVKLVEQEAEDLPPSVAVECRLGAQGAVAAFDSSRMNRVIINLLNNAVEAMVGKGGDRAQSATAAPRLAITSRVAERGVEIAVGDNGPGMTAAVRAKILEPLFTTKSFGTGLGLPAVVKILEQHDGGLDVETELGRGSVFTAWFPLRHVDQEAA